MKPILVLILICPAFCYAQLSRDQVCDKYLKAYQSGSASEMINLAGDSIVLYDATSILVGEELIIKSKENFTKVLPTMFEAVKELEFREVLNFKSGPYCISAGDFSYKPIANSLNKVIRYKVLTIIELDNNLMVIKHTDYADYESMLPASKN